jgi:hypothetical protein
VLGSTIVVLLLLAGGAVSPTPGTCSCIAIPEDGGWCDVHGIGYIGGVEIGSQMLFETLDPHGHEVDLASFECAGCRKAIDEEGFCDEHRVGFVDERAYYSRLSYLLARAPRVSVASIYCPTCRLHAAARGWCPACRRGLVGRSVFADRKTYVEVDNALDLVERADTAADRCVYCAVAMVSDTGCHVCGIEYRDGKPLPPATPESTGSAPAGQ